MANRLIWLIISAVVEVSGGDLVDRARSTLEDIQNDVIDYIDLLSDRTTETILENTEYTREYMLEKKLSSNMSSIAERYQKLKAEAADDEVNIDVCIEETDLDLAKIIQKLLETVDSCTVTYGKRMHEFEKTASQIFLTYSADAAAIVSKIKSCGGDTFCEQAAFSKLESFQKRLDGKVERKALIILEAFDLIYKEFLLCTYRAVEEKVNYLSNHVAAAEYCYRILA